MAKRAITNEGTLCSVCGAIVQTETKLCYQCDSPLEGEFKAVICSACGSVAPAENQTCPFCGVELSQASASAHMKPVPRDVDTDIVGAVDEVASLITAPSAPTSAKNAIAERLKKMNNTLLALDNAISKKSWIELTSIRNSLAEMIEDTMSILVSVKDIGGNVGAMEEIRQKEQYIEQKMAELRREMETREKEALRLKEKEKTLLVKEQVIDDKSDAIVAKSEEVQKIRSSLEKREKEIAAKEQEIAEIEKKIEEKIISQAQGTTARSAPPIPGDVNAQTKSVTEGIERAKVLTNQLIGYFKKRTADDSGKLVVALEKIVTQLDSIQMPVIQPPSAPPVPVPVPSQPDSRETDEQREELKRVLKTLDSLLEKLSEQVIAEFANSEEFKLYERVLDRYGV